MTITDGHTDIRNYGAAELRSSKAVAREMAGSRQALGRLMEQLRSRLEYGYSMGRVCQSYVLVVLMMVLGVSEMWAADYKYIIINNKGNEAFNYIISTGTTYAFDNTQFCIHPKAKSVLATNFRFYTTKDAAVADANGTIGIHYSLGDAIPTPTNENKTFYVRYDLVNNPAIDINAEKVYKMQVRDRNNNWYFVVYDGSENTIKMITDYGNDKKYYWTFDSGDPYDMYILNLQGLTDNHNGVFTVPNVVNTSGESSLSAIYYRDKVTTGYNQSANSMSLQSFILTKGSNIGYKFENGWQDVWSNSYQIIGAYNGIDNKPKDTVGSGSNYAAPSNMAYYVCANTAANNNPLQFYRNWRVEDTKSTNVSQIKFTEVQVTQNYTFHIINNSGMEVFSATTTTPLNVGVTITESMIPDILKSPVASNYRYYTTAADAAAGTNATTRLPYPSEDVYVRYETNSSEIDITGIIKYNISVGGTNYLYAADATTLSSEATSEHNTEDDHRWTLNGNDAYQFTIKNVGNNKELTYDVSEGEAVPTLSGTGSKFFLHQSISGKYELVAVPSNDYPTSYYTLGYDGTNGLKLYSSSNYSFENEKIQTEIIQIPVAFITSKPIANNRIYDGTEENLVTAGTVLHGTIKYREGTTGEYTTTIPTKKDVGTYSVYYMSEGDEGYEGIIATKPIMVTITPMALNKDALGTPADGITISVTKDTTDPANITYSVTVTQGEVTLTPYNENDPTAPYDYTLSGEASVSGYVTTVSAKQEGNVYTGNYTGFAKFIFADPTFYQDGSAGSLGANEYAAVYLSSSDVVPDANVKAYIVKKVNPTIGTITVSPVEYITDATTNPPTKANYIPAGIPVLLLSNNDNVGGLNVLPKDESAPGITDEEIASNRLMIAPEGGVTVKDTEAYMFYRGEFVLTQTGTIGAGKVFLYNPTYKDTPASTPSPSPSRYLQIVIEDYETGIEDVRCKMEDVGDERWYTLDGRCLSGKPTQKGLYIVNGKKVIIR